MKNSDPGSSVDFTHVTDEYNTPNSTIPSQNQVTIFEQITEHFYAYVHAVEAHSSALVKEFDGDDRSDVQRAPTQQAVTSLEKKMMVYTLVYNHCTTPMRWDSQVAEALHSDPTNTHKDGSKQTGYPPVQAMYDHYKFMITKYLQERYANIELDSNSSLLHQIVRLWENHKIITRWLERMFSYLDRFYMRLMHRENLRKCSLNHFKTIVFSNVQHKLVDSTLNMVCELRRTEQISDVTVCSIVNLFQEMFEYECTLELQYLECTSQWYRDRSAEWIQECNISEFLERAEHYFAEENQRLSAMNMSKSKQKLDQLLRETILIPHQKEVLTPSNGTSSENGFAHLLRKNMTMDLSRLQRLYTSVPKGLDSIAVQLKEFIIGEGMEMIQKHTSSKSPELDIRNFVQDILSLHDRFHHLTIHTLQHALFSRSVKDAFEYCLNQPLSVQNSRFVQSLITSGTCGRYPTITSSELLASCCDLLLRNPGTNLSHSGSFLNRSNLSSSFTSDAPSSPSQKLSSPRLVSQSSSFSYNTKEIELDLWLNKIIHLLNLISDRDRFIEWYRILFSKRLLEGSYNLTVEMNFVRKLQCEFGSSYPSRLEGMITDKQNNVELSKAFHEWLRKSTTTQDVPGEVLDKPSFTAPADNSSIVALLTPTNSEALNSKSTSDLNESETPVQFLGFEEFKVSVLTEGMWPSFCKESDRKLNVPEPVQKGLCEYERFYNSRTQNRVIKWIHHLAHGVLRGAYPHGEKILYTNAYQASVLYCFNRRLHAERWSGEELADQLGIEWEEVRNCLYAVCVRVPLLKRWAWDTMRPCRSPTNRHTVEAHTLHPKDEFEFNVDFSSPHATIRVPSVNVPTPNDSVSGRPSEGGSRDRSIPHDEDRRYAIEASLVRIMKRLQQCDHSQLIQECVADLSSFFVTVPQLIEHRIEDLLTREFIERVPGSPYSYRYVTT